MEDLWDLPKRATYDSESKTHRIFSSVLQTCSCTGRLIFDPQVQCVRKDRFSFRTANGESFEFGLRDVFIAQGQYLISNPHHNLDGKIPKYVFLSLDYAQIELRVMAHFSQDPLLIQLFTQVS